MDTVTRAAGILGLVLDLNLRPSSSLLALLPMDGMMLAPLGTCSYPPRNIWLFPSGAPLGRGFNKALI
ncbi:MAG: hypothetical protein NWE79_04635 [Candidatus Bathyarchaeota archaeon]|nr:hypothetical protein [Candidatus Bathyarchaeota archaeon]